MPEWAFRLAPPVMDFSTGGRMLQLSEEVIPLLKKLLIWQDCAGKFI